MTLRAYQTDFLYDVVAAFAGGARRVLGVLPTAAGKTVCFSELPRMWPDYLTCIIAHRRELIRQASKKLLPVRHGIIAPGHPFTRHRVQVASIQTLARRIGAVPKFGLLIPDEAHHTVSRQWQDFFNSQPDALALGVTATPERLDGLGLGVEAGGVFDAMVVGPSPASLIAQGYISPPRVFAPPNGIDFQRIRSLAGDFNIKDLADVMDRPTLTGDAVEHYTKHAAGLPAIAFCVSVAHAEHVAQTFRDAGYRSFAVHGKSPDRDALIAGLATGSVQVLTACDLISEGLDVPSVCAVILLRPTQSLALYLQMVGRGFRPAPGKYWLLVLDHAGNVLRHGMPEADREWTLEGIPRNKRQIPAVRQCPVCFAIHAPSRICPECGHTYHAAADGIRKLTAVDGELVEVTSESLGDPLPKLADVMKEARCWDDVERIRQERGYKPGWTALAMSKWRVGSRGGPPVSTAAQDFAVFVE